MDKCETEQQAGTNMHNLQGQQNTYLHFMSFLHTDMTQAVEIVPQVRQALTFST